MAEKNHDDVRNVIRKSYAQVANGEISCGQNSNSCCCSSEVADAKALKMGYCAEDLDKLPEGANMGLGCGNPQAIADLEPGETVVDLGSGGGVDCFLAAIKVGEEGKVIGVDMTPEMISKARKNAEEGGFANVDFRLGEMEHLPIADASVDVIISNCVINLSPDKPSVFAEAMRVLKSGGRLAIMDIVSSAELPKDLKDKNELLSGCIAGAVTAEVNEKMLTEAGFVNIKIQPKEQSKQFIRDWVPDLNVEDYIVSAAIGAIKPGNRG